MELKEAPILREDIFFGKIGVDVPLARLGAEKFWTETPVQGLAVSNVYGYAFFASPKGFGVTRTSHLCQLAQALKEKFDSDSTAQAKALLNVDLPNIRSLALSADDLVLAVSAGNKVHLYGVPGLVHKSDLKAFQTIEVGPGEDIVRDFSWSHSRNEAYILLSSGGKLVTGFIGDASKVVEEEALAASWSPDGQHLAYASKDGHLTIAAADLTHRFKFMVPQPYEFDEDVSVQVDTVRWVRSDSIMLGYTQITSKEEEDQCPLCMIWCQNGDLATERGDRTALSFESLFPSIDSLVIPRLSGPYMLAEYLAPWEMTLAASRRSVDDHIVILAWKSVEGSYSPCSLEIGNDGWVPRVELPEREGDNAVIGLAIDRTAEHIKLLDPRDETGSTMLPACPVLLCMTLEGKLSLYSFARWGLPDGVVATPLDLPTCSGTFMAPNKPCAEAEEVIPEVALNRSEEASTEEEGVESDLSEDGEQAGTESQAETSQRVESVEISSRPTGESESGSYLPATKSTSAPQQVNLLHERRDGGASQPKALGLQASAPPLVPQGISSVKTLGEVASAVNSEVGGQQLNSGVRSAKPIESVTGHLQGIFQPYSSAVMPQDQKSQLPLSSKEGTGMSGLSAKLSPSFSGQPFVSGPAPLAAVPGNTPTSQRPLTLVGRSLSEQAGRQTVMFSKPHVPSVPKMDQNKELVSQILGVSDMEAAFIIELEKVRKMAEELDTLMSYLQGRVAKGKNVPPAAYAKQSLEDVEAGIASLSENTKQLKKALRDEQLAVENVCDESVRVDVWRIYVQSLVEQAADVRHQDFWIRQKLHPELESRYKSVIQADQVLKQQIADLERHLHSLEFTNRQQANDLSRKKTASTMRNSHQFQAVQNLYNTVNAQMAVAEQLAQCITLQMRTLNLSPSPTPSNRTVQPATPGILKSIGVSSDDSQSVLSEDGFLRSPSSKARFKLSLDFGDLAIATPSWQHLPLESEAVQHESTRRRRDSMDMAWVGAGAAKTTIKRAARVKPMRSLSPTVVKPVKTQPRSLYNHLEKDVQDIPHLQRVVGSKPPADGVPVPDQPRFTHKDAVRTTVSFERSEQFSPVTGEQWNYSDNTTRLSFQTSGLVRESSNVDTDSSKHSMFKWAQTGSLQSASTLSQAPSFSFTSSAGTTTYSTLESGGPRLDAGAGLSGATNGLLEPCKAVVRPSATGGKMERPDSGIASSGQVIGTLVSASETTKAEARSSYRPSPSRMLELEAEEAKIKLTAETELQIRTSESDDGRRVQDPRESKLSKTKDSGSSFGVHTSQSTVPVFGIAGSQAIALTVSSSAAVSLTTGTQSFASQAVANPTFGSLVSPAAAMSSSAAKDLPTTVSGGSVFASVAQKAVVLSSSLQTAAMNHQPASSPPVSEGASAVAARLSFSPPAPEKAAASSVEAIAPHFNSLSSLTPAETSPSEKSPAVSSGVFSPSLGSFPSSGMTSSLSASQTTPAFAPAFGQASKQPGVALFGASSTLSPSSAFGAALSKADASSPQLGFPRSSAAAMPSTASFQSLTGDSDEENMDEEVPSAAPSGFGGFGGFGSLGLGSTASSPSEKQNPFGVQSASFSPSPGFSTSPSSRQQLFRPAGFTLPSVQSSSSSPFKSGFESASGAGFGFGAGSSSAFGQRAQIGQGQQALESALGSFGQTRQPGQGFAASGFGAAGSGSGFVSVASGAGFAGAATGGGFAGAATGGGFAGAASGGGFAGAASGGGFAGAALGGGFAGAASGGGFGGAASGGGGFLGTGGFGGSPGFGASVQTPLFTQMRK